LFVDVFWEVFLSSFLRVEGEVLVSSGELGFLASPHLSLEVIDLPGLLLDVIDIEPDDFLARGTGGLVLEDEVHVIAGFFIDVVGHKVGLGLGGG
jgi:hypothetical protein